MQASPALRVVVVSTGRGSRRRAAAIAAGLRSQGVSTVLAPDRSFKAQMRYANQQSAIYAVIAGERELAAGQVAVKPLQSGEGQSLVDVQRVAAAVGDAGKA